MSESGDQPVDLAEWQPCQASETSVEPAKADVAFEDIPLEQLSKRTLNKQISPDLKYHILKKDHSFRKEMRIILQESDNSIQEELVKYPGD